MGRQEYVEIDLEILNETEKAFRITDGDIYCWIAKSVIQNYEDDEWGIGDTETMVIPIWLAEDEGLI
jgi:hypothetical protein